MIINGIFFILDFRKRLPHIVQCVIERITGANFGVTHFLGVSSLN